MSCIGELKLGYIYIWGGMSKDKPLWAWGPRWDWIRSTPWAIAPREPLVERGPRQPMGKRATCEHRGSRAWRDGTAAPCGGSRGRGRRSTLEPPAGPDQGQDAPREAAGGDPRVGEEAPWSRPQGRTRDKMRLGRPPEAIPWEGEETPGCPAGRTRAKMCLRPCIPQGPRQAHGHSSLVCRR